jgi:hypothetical protein
MAINLDLIAQQKERDMVKAFAAAVADIKNTVQLNELESAIERQDADAVVRLLGIDRAAFEQVDDEIYQAYRTGGLTGVEQIGRIPTELGNVAFRFDMGAPAAIDWIRAESSQLVTEIVTDQVAMIQQQLERGLELGNNPRTTACDLVGRYNPETGRRTGGTIGLTTQQTGWINKARDELLSLDKNYLTRELRDKRFDSVIQKAIEDGKPLTKAQIDNAINRMQSNTLRFRGEVIARTESINALRAGQFQAVQQSLDVGELDSQDASKAWDATGDSRTRLDHWQMEAKYKDGIPINEAFQFPDGTEAMYPGDNSLGASAKQVIQCRCRNVIKIDFIGKQVRMEGFK